MLLAIKYPWFLALSVIVIQGRQFIWILPAANTSIMNAICVIANICVRFWIFFLLFCPFIFITVNKRKNKQSLMFLISLKRKNPCILLCACCKSSKFMFVNYTFICIHFGVCAFLCVYDLFGFKFP